MILLRKCFYVYENIEQDIEKTFGIPVEIEWVEFSELPIVFHKINRIIDLTSKS